MGNKTSVLTEITEDIRKAARIDPEWIERALAGEHKAKCWIYEKLRDFDPFCNLVDCYYDTAPSEEEKRRREELYDKAQELAQKLSKEMYEKSPQQVLEGAGYEFIGKKEFMAELIEEAVERNNTALLGQLRDIEEECAKAGVTLADVKLGWVDAHFDEEDNVVLESVVIAMWDRVEMQDVKTRLSFDEKEREKQDETKKDPMAWAEIWLKKQEIAEMEAERDAIDPVGEEGFKEFEMLSQKIHDAKSELAKKWPEEHSTGPLAEDRADDL